jgi:hypothetical protein
MQIQLPLKASELCLVEAVGHHVVHELFGLVNQKATPMWSPRNHMGGMPQNPQSRFLGLAGITTHKRFLNKPKFSFCHQECMVERKRGNGPLLVIWLEP